MKKRINNVFYNLTIIAFLFPLGMKSYFPILALISKILLYFAMGYCLWSIFNRNKKIPTRINKPVLMISVYFAYLVIETVIMLGGINEGLQKLFAIPILCLYILGLNQIGLKKFERTVENIVLCIMALNCTVFSPPLLQILLETRYNELIHFIGHVQVVASLGCLGIYLGIRTRDKSRSLALIGLSLINIIISRTEAGIVMLVILFLFWVSRKIMLTVFTKVHYNTIFNILVVLNVITVYIVITYRVDFGARFGVWTTILNEMKDHVVFGFGVYGIEFFPFWDNISTGVGMNYAHNILFQTMIDGGVILTFAFILLMNYLMNKVKDENRRIGYWARVLFLAVFVNGIVDVPTEYNYIWIFLMLLVRNGKLIDNVYKINKMIVS